MLATYSGNLELMKSWRCTAMHLQGVARANLLLGEIRRLLAIMIRRDESTIENEEMTIKFYHPFFLVNLKTESQRPTE